MPDHSKWSQDVLSLMIDKRIFDFLNKRDKFENTVNKKKMEFKEFEKEYERMLTGFRQDLIHIFVSHVIRQCFSLDRKENFLCQKKSTIQGSK